MAESGRARFENAISGYVSQYYKVEMEAMGRGETFPSKEDTFIRFIYDLQEVYATLDAIKLIEVMFELPQPVDRRIHKHAYLLFLITSYLNEMYILRERLIACAKKVSRL